MPTAFLLKMEPASFALTGTTFLVNACPLTLTVNPFLLLMVCALIAILATSLTTAATLLLHPKILTAKRWCLQVAANVIKATSCKIKSVILLTLYVRPQITTDNVYLATMVMLSKMEYALLPLLILTVSNMDKMAVA